jgi:tape measure domain-containing protein
MTNFANLTASLNLNYAKFAKNMKKASTLTTKFAADMNGQINTGMVEPAKKAKFQFKDVARIVQGIIISRVFYGSLTAIRQATDAVWEFSKSLEYAQLVFSNLFGDADLATEFINVLKDFASITPFSFQQSEEAAKRLLAYGIEYQNIMYVMQGVLAAATVQGTEAIIEPISRAFGQIYTKGRLMNEEMRQLAEAGIPVYEILQEKLGLTAKELRNLGNVAVPANEAINALIEGINERFGTTLQLASSTTRGIISNIKDNALMLFAGVFTPFTDKLKISLGVIGTFLNELKDASELRGLGGVFNRLIPEDLRESVKMLIVNFMALGSILKGTFKSALKIIKTALVVLMGVFNAINPIILAVAGTINGLLSVLASNEKLVKAITVAVLAASAAWLIYKAQVIAAAATTVLLKSIRVALKGIVIAMNFIVAHPVWALLAVAVGTFVALTGASEAFRRSINGIYQSFFALGGLDTSNMFLPESNDMSADVDKFNEALGGTSTSMDDLANSTAGAAKAAKGLLSFDEIFSLKDTSGSGAASDVPDYSGLLGTFQGIDLSDLALPGAPEVANGFIDNIIESLGLGDKVLSTAIGTLLGAALGAVFGSPQLGAALGALAGWFWPSVATALNLTDVGTVSIPIATGIGAAIGFIAGGPLGALIGGAIGGLVGWIADSITRGIQKNDWTKVGLPLGMGLGAAIGMIVGGPPGALIGGAIGALIGWITDRFTTGFTTGKWKTKSLSTAIGGGIGAAIGMIIGGPPGALIGGAIGALIGWVTGLIITKWSNIKAWTKGVDTWATDIMLGISKAFGKIETSINTFFANIGLSVITWASNLFKPVVTSAKRTKENLDEVWTNIKTGFTDISEGLEAVSSDILTAITTVHNRIKVTTRKAWILIKGIFVKYGTKIYDVVVEKFDFVKTEITEVLDDIKLAVSLAWTDIKTAFSTKLTEISTVVKEKFELIKQTIKEKLGLIVGIVSQKFIDIKDSITEKLKLALTSVSEKFQEMWDTITEKLDGAWEAVKTAFIDIKDTIEEKMSGMYENVKTGIANIYGEFTGWISDMWTNVFEKFFGWIDTAITKLSEFFGLEGDAQSYSVPTPSTTLTSYPQYGHATGGIFNREHIARFSEGNKKEAIIPLENKSAMQPFVDAVANGLSAVLLPIASSMSGANNQLQPLYVGTLIADDRGLKELERKMQVVRLSESQRRN